VLSTGERHGYGIIQDVAAQNPCIAHCWPLICRALPRQIRSPIATMAVILAGAAALAALPTSLRAARVDPMVSLRAD
jgi:hypothetical protein